MADQLLALPLPELVDVMSRVLPEHGEQDSRHGRALLLAQMWWSGTDGPTSEDGLEGVAWPDRDFYDGGFGPDPDLWQNGTCRMCNTDVVSTARRATCPVCSGPCALV
jgi:hypothetical protein